MRYAVRLFLTFESENSSLSDNRQMAASELAAMKLAAVEQFAADAANDAHDSLERLPGVKGESIEAFYAAFPEGSAVYTAVQKAMAAQCEELAATPCLAADETKGLVERRKT